jgi:ABC-2 type transport system permease protein
MIALKFAMLRHSLPGLRLVGWVLGAAAVAGTWGVALAVDDAGVRRSVLTLLLAVWLVGGAVGPVLTSGAGALRAEYFTLLPLSRREVGQGLLVSVLVSIASGFVLLAQAAVAGHAAGGGAAAVAVALVGAVLGWLLVVVLSRLVYGLLGAAMQSRLGIEIAGVQFGVMFAAMFAGWMIVSVVMESVPALLRRGLPDGPVTSVLEAMPSSWPLLAADRAAAGDLGGAVGRLALLAAVVAVLLVVTVALLVPRSARTARRRGRARSVRLVAGGGLLPATQTGAVVGKEVRQWRRDPWRALESSTALWTGVVIGVLALLNEGVRPVAAFSGVIVAFVLGLSGCNLYGQDGTAVWQNVVGQDATSARADVRGRQWAMVLVFAPRVLVVTVPFLVLSGAWWTLPLVAAAVPAVLGAATGAAVLTSAVGVSPGVDPRRRVGPNDANGNIALHVWVVLVAIAVAVAPTAALAAWVVPRDSTALGVLLVVVGLLDGVVAAWLLGRVAIAYLGTRMEDVFSRIRYDRVFGDRSGGGVLGWIARTTLRGEVRAKELKQQERDKRLAGATAGSR